MALFALIAGPSAKAWGQNPTRTWDLTSTSTDWTATGNETYFSQPYGYKKANGTLTNKNVADFTTYATEGKTITSIKVGFKGLRNGSTASKITISLVDNDGNILTSGSELELTNASAASNTAYVYSTFTTGFTGATGFMMKVTTFGKNVLINGASYEIEYTEVGAPELESIAISGNPTKTTYEAGEEFDPAGLVVTGTYTEGDPEVITSGIDWTITPNPLTAGTTSVSVTAKVGEVESPAYQVNGLTVTEFVQTYANTYTSDASLSSVITGSKVKWEGCKVTDGYAALKIAKAGTATITVPAGTKTVHLHMVAWNGESADVAVKLGETTLPSIKPTADAGVSGTSTTYTIATEPKTENSYYFAIEVNTDEEATLSLTTASSKRAILFGVNFEADTEPSITADVEEIEFEQKELSGTVTDNKTISATGKNLTAPISASMKSGSAAVFSVVANGTPTAAAGEFTVSYSTTEAGEYAGTVVLSSGETSIEIPVSVNVVAHIPVLQSVAVSGTPDKTEYTEGDAFETAGLVVTGTYDVGDPQIITEGIEWTVTPSGALAANVTSVSVVATVDGVASEAFNVDITVVELPKWAKVTANKTDWSGEYLLVYENEGTAYVWTGVDAAGCNAPVTISNNQITKPADAVSLTIASMDGGYSILVNGGTNDGKYISGKSGSNTVNFETTASANTLAYSNGNVTITSNTSTIMYNSNSSDNRFRYYKSGSSQKAVQLYEKVLPPTYEAVTFAAPEGGSLVIKNGATPISSGAIIQNGTVLDVTFGMTPAEAYKDVAIKVTKTEGGDDVTSTVYNAETKEITMPRYAITVEVTSTKLYKIEAATVTGGTLSWEDANKAKPTYVEVGTYIQALEEAATHYEFKSFDIYKTGETTTKVEATDGIFEMPAYDVTISGTFDEMQCTALPSAPVLGTPSISYSDGVTLNWNKLDVASGYLVNVWKGTDKIVEDEMIEDVNTISFKITATMDVNTEYSYSIAGLGDDETYCMFGNLASESTFTTADYPAVVLTLSENGITSTIDGKLNTPIDLPTTSTQTCEDKVFVGWSATTIDGETGAEPSLLGETYTFTNPEQLTATIYAVYAKETPGESSNWEITSIDKPGTGTGYAPYNGSHTTDNISYTTSQIMMSSDNKIQFQKNAGYMYNTTPFSGDILFITIADITSNISVYEGSTEITTTPTSGAITLDEGKYTFSKGKKYFHIKMGNATGYSSKITVAVAGAPTYSNYCTTTSIVISENTVWNDDVTINGYTVTIESGAVLTVNGALINENASNLVIEDGAQLIHHNAGVNATVKKSITGYTGDNDNYYLIANPTDNATVAHLTENNYDLYTFDPTQALEWHYEKESNTLTSGIGYLYANRATTTLEFVGALTPAGSTNLPLEFYNGTDSGRDFPGFNLIGNPYTCNVYLNKDAYVLNDDDFVSIDAGTAIAPCQGFFVEAKQEDKSVTLSTAAPVTVPNALNITVSQNRGNVIDRAIVNFNGSNNLHKFMMNPAHTNLSIAKGSETFAAISTEAEGELPVNFKAEKNGTYTITVNTENVDAEYLHLIDNMTGMDVDLLATPSYTFEAKTSDYASRFKLVFGVKNEASESSDSSFAFMSNGNLVIDNIEGEATLQIVDELGRVISTETVSGSYNKALNLKAGLYIINLNGMTQKIVVE